jgi:hypothetical protein
MVSWFGKYFERKINRSEYIGFLLMAFGAIISEFSFVYLSNISLTAVGISSVIIGSVTALGKDDSSVDYFGLSIIRESYSNIEELLREFKVYEVGIYPPIRNGKVIAYVPLSKKLEPEEIVRGIEIPNQSLTEINGESILVVFLPISYDILTSVKKDKNIEKVLANILVYKLKMLDSLKVREYEDVIVVTLAGSKIESRYPLTEKTFGSIPASLSGCIISSLLNESLVFINESKSQNNTTARFKIIKSK